MGRGDSVRHAVSVLGAQLRARRDARAVQVALDNNQPEAAFDIYRKAGMKIEALNTLVERIEDFDRAHEYATKVDDPATWSTLGHAQLARGQVNDAIGSYLLAKDSSKYMEVTAMAKETKQYDDLVRFLMMVRDKIKDPKVDTEIAIAYAMTDKLGELEAFITSAPSHLGLDQPLCLCKLCARARAILCTTQTSMYILCRARDRDHTKSWG